LPRCGKARPRSADGKLLRAPNNHAFAFALRVRVKAFEETVHEKIPPPERGGAGPAVQPYPGQPCHNKLLGSFGEVIIFQLKFHHEV
jgi:hypothetical protein